MYICAATFLLLLAQSSCLGESGHIELFEKEEESFCFGEATKGQRSIVRLSSGRGRKESETQISPSDKIAWTSEHHHTSPTTLFPPPQTSDHPTNPLHFACPAVLERESEEAKRRCAVLCPSRLARLWIPSWRPNRGIWQRTIACWQRKTNTSMLRGVPMREGAWINDGMVLMCCVAMSPSHRTSAWRRTCARERLQALRCVQYSQCAKTRDQRLTIRNRSTRSCIPSTCSRYVPRAMGV